MSNVQEQAARLVQSLSDKQLIDAYVEIIGRPKSPENNSVRIWLIDEIESRFPEVQEKVTDSYFDTSLEKMTYDERLLSFIKEGVTFR